MSYSRWGAPISVNIKTATGENDPVDATVAWHALSIPERKEIAQQQGGALSDWYIYWDVASDQQLGRNGQLLAIWYAGGQCHPLMDYQELRRIADQDRWELIHGFSPDHDPINVQNVKECVREWLRDVEDDYPETEPMSRFQLAEAWTNRAKQHARAALEAKDTEPSEAFENGLHALSFHARVKQIGRQAEADQDPDLPAIRELEGEAAQTAQEVHAVTRLPKPQEQ